MQRDLVRAAHSTRRAGLTSQPLRACRTSSFNRIPNKFAFPTFHEERPFLKEPDALLKYNRWVLFYENDDHIPDNLIACALFDVTPCGIKGRFRASDLSPAGKQAVKSFAIASYNAMGAFGEISGLLEEAIVASVHTVPVAEATKVMEKLGHSIQDAGADHYTREIHGETITKVMVGYPVLPDDDT